MSNHDFGGRWTETKLEALAEYLGFFTQALKKQHFRLLYVDAFAGTGTVGVSENDAQGVSLFRDPERNLLAGSARRALETEPPFDRYIFVDQEYGHVAALKALSAEFPELDIRIVRADANRAIGDLVAQTDWQSWRAVVFLDPYGTQVEWKTLVELAETQAVDVWVLVPFGIAYNRMLPNSGEVPDGWAERLTAAFGTDEWRDVAYERVETTVDMFTGEHIGTSRRKLEDVERWFKQRLGSAFAGVEGPIRLENSNGTWLYSLFFAVANPANSARGLALKGARYIIDTFGD